MANEKMDTSMAGDEDDRKLFAGGLPQDAKEADIRGHFGQFGEIESITLKTDMATGRSRGFCFIVYKTTDGLDKAVSQSEHNIQNKKVAVKKAQAKQGKVYIGKLPADLSDDDIKNHMATFGTIANIEQPFDKMKSERKNFCFITYEREDVAKKLLKEGTVYINGHEMEVKKVTPKPQFPGGMDPSQMYMMGRGGYHGGPGGHGQWGGPGGQWGGGYGLRRRLSRRTWRQNPTGYARRYAWRNDAWWAWWSPRGSKKQTLLRYKQKEREKKKLQCFFLL